MLMMRAFHGEACEFSDAHRVVQKKMMFMEEQVRSVAAGPVAKKLTDNGDYGSAANDALNYINISEAHALIAV